METLREIALKKVILYNSIGDLPDEINQDIFKYVSCIKCKKHYEYRKIVYCPTCTRDSFWINNCNTCLNKLMNYDFDCYCSEECKDQYEIFGMSVNSWIRKKCEIMDLMIKKYSI